MKKRTIKQALEHAERLKKELPLVAQVNASDWDLVLVADMLKMYLNLSEDMDNWYFKLDSKNQIKK